MINTDEPLNNKKIVLLGSYLMIFYHFYHMNETEKAHCTLCRKIFVGIVGEKKHDVCM